VIKIHHIGYAVQDLEKSINEFFELGYSKKGDTTHDHKRKVAIQFMKNGIHIIELIAPLSESSPINSILMKVGNSPYHMCYEVDDMVSEITRLSQKAYIVLEDAQEALAIDRRRVAFLYHDDVGLIELIESATGISST